MILLAKKEPICLLSSTRPISIIDSFQKLAEKLFPIRFHDLLWRRGLLPDNQSGFREGFRLQFRLLLFLEDIPSLMSNSSPVCTMFVDFRKAFDQLWFLGCIGKGRGRLRLEIAPLPLKSPRGRPATINSNSLISKNNKSDLPGGQYLKKSLMCQPAI